MNLANKNILLGISGGIAAYKCPELVRQLKKQGAQVRVVMTDCAKHFVSALSLQAVSGNQVHYDLFNASAELSMGHIELAKWADLIVIAPSTANTIAKLTAGIADDLLTTLCLATTSPIVIVPAMNQQMYHSAITQQNINTLTHRGILAWGPDQGVQACGDVGLGRMLEPSELCSNIINFFSRSNRLSSLNLSPLNIVITAGPTQEALDPVRYITNHSSGKMGFAIAKVAADLGAKVTLISGVVHLSTPKNVIRKEVTTALEMYENTLKAVKTADIFIACAAVADYRAAVVADKKIKKHNNQNELTITLIKNPDIVAEVAALKQNRPFVVGFAAETDHIEEHALKKLNTKHLDMICANDVSSPVQGFNTDTNALTLYWKKTKEHQTNKLSLPLTHKNTLATQLVTEIIKHYNEHHNNEDHHEKNN